MHNVLVLTVAQFLGAFGQVINLVLAGIIGALLAPDSRLATLPVTFFVLGMAAATAPAALTMQRYGRRYVFAGSALWGCAGAALAALGISLDGFWLFCFGSCMLGSNMAVAAQFRFAAAESVNPERVSKAVAWVMTGTLGAAVLAPPLAVASRDWTGTEYVGSYLVLSVLYILAAFLLLALRTVRERDTTDADEARPIGQVIRQPTFIVAVLASAVGYAVMTMIMTATPLSMHVMDRHSVATTAVVIQSHILAMYLPSLISGVLVARLGVPLMMTLGVICETLGIAIALAGRDVLHYWLALVALGIGWNLLFVAGTTLLTTTYRPTERFRAQAINDFCMFGVMALVSLMAGILISAVGWRILNLISLAPLLGMLAVIIFWTRRRRSAD